MKQKGKIVPNVHNGRSVHNDHNAIVSMIRTPNGNEGGAQVMFISIIE